MSESGTPKEQISRRSLLRGIPVVAGVAATLGTMGIQNTARAQAKLTHVQAKYQDTPKNGQECSTCLQFQPPNACAIVMDPISPRGWCQFYGKKT
jgi:hypothetical protein